MYAASAPLSFPNAPNLLPTYASSTLRNGASTLEYNTQRWRCEPKGLAGAAVYAPIYPTIYSPF